MSRKINISIRLMASQITGHNYANVKDLLAWLEESKELTDNSDVHKFIDTQISAIKLLPVLHNRIQDVQPKPVEA